MELVKEEWWPTPIYYIDIPIDVVNFILIEQEVKNHRDIDTGRIRSNRGGYQSNDVNIANYCEIKKLYSFTESCFQSCHQEWGIKDQISYKISNTWININTKEHFNMPHIHPSAVFSAVYYVKCSLDHPPLTFESTSAQNFLLSSISNPSSKYTYSHIHYEVKVGRLIIFPAWLNHYVDKQVSDDERISISFNSGYF